MDFSLATLMSAAKSVNYSTFSSLAFLLYDHVLTFDAEVELIWSQKLSFGKLLFIFNRYFTPFTLVFNIFVYTSYSVTIKFCEGFHWWETTSEAIVVLTIEVILVARIYAVYDRNKKLLAVLAGCFLAEITATLGLVYRGLPHGIPRPYDQLTGCYVSGQPAFYFLTWIPALIFETILCTLMLYKAWETYRLGGDKASPLLRLIIRDSVLYFSIIFVALVVNCLIWALASANLLEVALGWAAALPCSLGCRLLLNMRQRTKGAVSSQTTIMDIEFGAVGSIPVSRSVI